MSGSLERIDRDVAALEEAISTIASEFGRAYTNYLGALGQATRQQLVLACFHLCTQGYPESFLKLTFHQREQLQEEIRKLASSGQQQLEEMISPDGLAVRYQEPHSYSQKEAEDRGDCDTASESDSEVVEEETDTSHESLGSASETILPESQTIAPEQLVNWQKRVEIAIGQILQTLSNQANRLLQTSGVLPNQLPAPVSDDAKAEAIDSVSSPPNLLNLVVESENTKKRGGKPKITEIVAIYLRLTEIEFGEANVSAWRTQIRQLSQRLNALGQQYYQKRQEQVVAQAESAWRSSWFED
ncbi:hypothetical protein IQ235_08620 [Oscillatoriales cyanobacterium LEGE 11467]|uniref:Uncharacterized protein n=1 Tax=Zarconia navalis LEGE 11467 TaxID=1828826 RepID=A0A928Z9J8_9CYAN|nr:hypothetical protein [Zarconia navalis]MBE9040841.1 hypothetical protein [Zarconia navalis LEGE 11467]